MLDEDTGISQGPSEWADSDTQLDEAAVDAFVANNGYALDADLHAVAKSGDGALTNKPNLLVGIMAIWTIGQACFLGVMPT